MLFQCYFILFFCLINKILIQKQVSLHQCLFRVFIYDWIFIIYLFREKPAQGLWVFPRADHLEKDQWKLGSLLIGKWSKANEEAVPDMDHHLCGGGRVGLTLVQQSLMPKGKELLGFWGQTDVPTSTNHFWSPWGRQWIVLLGKSNTHVANERVTQRVMIFRRGPSSLNTSSVWLLD